MAYGYHNKILVLSSLRVSSSHGLALLLGSLWTFLSGRGKLLSPDRGPHLYWLDSLGRDNFVWVFSFL